MRIGDCAETLKLSRPLLAPLLCTAGGVILSSNSTLADSRIQALRALRDNDVALDETNEMIGIAQSKNLPIFVATALLEKGELLAELGRGNFAVETLEQALAIRETDGQ